MWYKNTFIVCGSSASFFRQCIDKARSWSKLELGEMDSAWHRGPVASLWSSLTFYVLRRCKQILGMAKVPLTPTPCFVDWYGPCLASIWKKCCLRIRELCDSHRGKKFCLTTYASAHNLADPTFGPRSSLAQRLQPIKAGQQLWKTSCSRFL